MPFKDEAQRLAYHRNYYLHNKARIKQQNHDYYAHHAATYKARAVLWNRANVAKVRAKDKRWKIKNRDKINARSRELQPRRRVRSQRYNASISPEKRARKYEMTRQWGIRNPDKIKARNAHYRAAKKTSDASFAAIEAWMSRVRHAPIATCYYCKECFPPSKIHFDHVLPLARGGKHVVENLCVSCPDCNLSKHAKLPHEWRKHAQALLSL